MKIITLHSKKIINKNKILAFDASITKIMTNPRIPIEHHENHENHRIPYDNFESHEKHKTQGENH